jgi:hypothetical protein
MNYNNINDHFEVYWHCELRIKGLKSLQNMYDDKIVCVRVTLFVTPQ